MGISAHTLPSAMTKKYPLFRTIVSVFLLFHGWYLYRTSVVYYRLKPHFHLLNRLESIPLPGRNKHTQESVISDIPYIPSHPCRQL